MLQNLLKFSRQQCCLVPSLVEVRCVFRKRLISVLMITHVPSRKCPTNLIAPLIKIVIEEIRKACKKQPMHCGFNPADNAYEPLKLMQTVMAKTNEVCLRYLDNSMLCSLPVPGTPFNATSAHAVRNSRKRMEDRHVVIDDLNTMFNIQEASPSSYYAVFDGHAGQDAAAYSAAHLHQFLAENKYFVSDPKQALMDAFCKTDALFIEKCKVENLSSGTTAVVALLRPKEKALYVAWAGDSQALLVNQGRVLQVVNPHKPCRQDEKERIEKDGGCVMLWGTWRVNGQLAVSRAIGDAEYKPYVIAIPEIREITLDGGEDFLIIACDGLWDFLSEDCAAAAVYKLVAENPDDTDRISQHLVHLSKKQGSNDNISVIVVFLREPSKIAADACWARIADDMEASLDNANGPFGGQNGTPDDNAVGLLLNLTDSFKRNGAERSPKHDLFDRPSSKRPAPGEFDDEDDFGPETDIDALDDSPSAADEGVCNPFVEHQEKAALEMERHQKQRAGLGEEEERAREEAPTPPADAVHDVSGLEENVAESDSEDEWNYIKGEEANKENKPLQPEKKVAEIPEEDDDTMSQLNPNAAEFVPVSPTRSIPSPSVCSRLMNDPVIAQSPKRPVNIDIKLPNPSEFEREVKSRPSDVDSYSNGHNEDEDRSTPTDLMESILNGKNIDDIPEFQPGSTPKRGAPSEEFHFGPNAAPFTPIRAPDQSEAALSTCAIFGDESAATLDASLGGEEQPAPVGKEADDPMSMSFYADKGDANPFDLNKVQVLPEDLDAYLQQPDGERLLDDTISDLPENDPLAGMPLNNDDAIQTTDLDKQSEPLEPEREESADSERDPLESDVDCEPDEQLESRVQVHRDPSELDNEEEEEDLGIGVEEADFARTPEPTHENLVENVFCHVSEKSDVPKPDTLSPDVELITPESTHENLAENVFCHVSEKSDVPEADTLPSDVELITPESTTGADLCHVSEKSEVLAPDTLPSDVELITPENPIGTDFCHVVEKSDVLAPDTLPSDVELITPENPIGTDFCHVGEKSDVLAPDTLPSDVELITPESTHENLASEKSDVSPSETLPPDVELLTPEFTGNLVENVFCRVKETSDVSQSETLPPDVELLTPEFTGNLVEDVFCRVKETSDVSPSETLPPDVELVTPENPTGTEICHVNEKSDVLAPDTLPSDVELVAADSKSEMEALATDSESVEPEEVKLEVETATADSELEHKPEIDPSESEPVSSSEVADLLGLPQVSSSSDRCPDSTSAEVVEEAQQHFEELCRPSAPESPQGDATITVGEDLAADQSSLLGSPKDAESVATTDVDSFLDRSLPPEVQSPLSVGEADATCVHPTNSEPHELSQQELADYLNHPLSRCVFPLPPQYRNEQVHIETDVISREFAEPAVVTPSEESRQEEQEEAKPVEAAAGAVEAAAGAVGAAAALGAVSAVAAATAVEEKKKPVGAAKKPAGVRNGVAAASKTTARSPAVAKTGAARAAASPRAAPAKPGLTKPAAAAAVPKTAAPKPIAKPKTTPTTKVTEKKPLANGDVKPAARSTLTAKKAPSETTSAPKSSVSARLASAAPKSSPTKPTAAPRPASAPRPAPRPAPATGASSARAAARPTSLAARPHSVATAGKSASATARPAVSRAPNAAPKPRAAPVGATSAPSRAPSSRTALKAADTEKQNKESANKMTAARNASRTVSAATGRRVESKTSATRTTVSKTTTTTKSTTAKKPLEIVKTKTTKIVEKQPKQNGTTATATVIEEFAAVVEEIDSSALLKDNSPLVDNKLMEAEA